MLSSFVPAGRKNELTFTGTQFRLRVALLLTLVCARTRWIIAKYRWYGFVGDDKRDPPLVSKALIHVRCTHLLLRLLRGRGACLGQRFDR